MHEYRDLEVKVKVNGRWYYGYFLHHEDTVFCFAEDYERAAMMGKDPRHNSLIVENQGDWGLPNRLEKIQDIDMTTLSIRSPYTVTSKNAHGRKTITRLYENDIISVELCAGKDYCGVVRFGEYATIGELAPYNYGWYIDWTDPGARGMLRCELGYWCKKEWLTVRGNTFDYD